MSDKEAGAEESGKFAKLVRLGTKAVSAPGNVVRAANKLYRCRRGEDAFVQTLKDQILSGKMGFFFAVVEFRKHSESILEGSLRVEAEQKGCPRFDGDGRIGYSLRVDRVGKLSVAIQQQKAFGKPRALSLWLEMPPQAKPGGRRRLVQETKEEAGAPVCPVGHTWNEKSASPSCDIGYTVWDPIFVIRYHDTNDASTSNVEHHFSGAVLQKQTAEGIEVAEQRGAPSSLAQKTVTASGVEVHPEDYDVGTSAAGASHASTTTPKRNQGVLRTASTRVPSLPDLNDAASVLAFSLVVLLLCFVGRWLRSLYRAQRGYGPTISEAVSVAEGSKEYGAVASSP
ncbi:unnamed protein product [Amoebophrya sp. A25]|nr:unnamed protein product [Amoebophrya sp. A25]|eukprot:GSA25T00007172001.1